MKTVWTVACVLLSVGGTFAATPPGDVITLEGHWSLKQGLYTTEKVWTNAVAGGGYCAWTQGAYGVVKDYWAGNNSLALYSAFSFWGLCFEKAPNNWATVSSSISVGAGGIALPNGGKFGFGDEKGAYLLNLTADQTWSGGATATSGLSVGYEGYNDYYRAGARANGCTKLTLTGRLNTIFSWTNDFSATDIRVEAPATLSLAKSWKVSATQKIGRPELHAKSLTLSGDGSLLQAGGTFSSPYGYTITRETRLDANTVAPVVTLEHGADLTGTSGELDIASLVVTGGESSVLGTFSLLRETTDVLLADGGVLALEGTLTEGTGVSAGFNVTGEGTLRISLDEYKLSGALALGEDVDLVLTGGDDFAVPVTGGRKISVANTGNGVVIVSKRTLAGFTGSAIEVTQGQVHFEAVPAGVQVTSSGTGKVVTTDDFPTLYGYNYAQNQIVWTNAAGEASSWIKNADAVLKRSIGRSNNLGILHLHGLTLDMSTDPGYWIAGGKFYIGAGGITFARAAQFASGNDKWNSHLCLTADQTWRGLSEERDAYALVEIGYPAYSNPYPYHRMGLEVTDAVSSLTMCGRLRSYFCTTNDLSHVDLRIESPASLCVLDSWRANGGQVVGDAHLRARSLTLSGDGDMMLPLGADVPYPKDASGLKTVTRLDAAYVAGSLTLENGADLTASAPTVFALPGLTAKGAGESVLSGTFDFVRPTVAVTLADGATVYLAGTFRETAEGTSLSATGSGTLKISPAGYGLTGGLTLGSDVTLAVVGKGQLSVPVTGGNAATFDAGGAALFVPAATLEQFSGDTVTVSSGTVVFESLPAGVSVVEAGGKALMASDATDGMVVTDAVRTEAELTVGEGETLYVCGNGLTDATHVTLAGGTLAFCRTATVGSDIYGALTTPAKTFVRTEAANVVGTIGGFVAVTNDVAANSRTFAVAGAGTVDFTGGADFKRVQFFVTGGSVNLRTAAYKFWQQHWGVKGGQYLGIRDGATVSAPWPAESGTYGLYSEPAAGCTSVVEICENSSVVLNQSITMYLGLWHDAVARGILRLNGGTLTVSHGAAFGIGYPDEAYGILELKGGLLSTDQPFRTFANGTKVFGHGFVDWTGGTVKLGPDFFKYAGTSPSVRYFDGSGMNMSVRIGGPTCVLDLSKAPAFTNVAARAENAGSWTWTEGGRLTVTNGGTFVMNRFPENGCVAVSNCRLEIADDTVPSVGEIGFAGPTTDTIVGRVEGLAADTLRIADGGEFDARTIEGQVDGITWTNLAFDPGAVFLMTVNPDGTMPLCTVPGSVIFAEQLGYRLNRIDGGRPGARTAVLTVTGDVVGAPEFVAVGRVPKGMQPRVDGKDLVLEYTPVGMILLVK